MTAHRPDMHRWGMVLASALSLSLPAAAQTGQTEDNPRLPDRCRAYDTGGLILCDTPGQGAYLLPSTFEFDGRFSNFFTWLSARFVSGSTSVSGADSIDSADSTPFNAQGYHISVSSGFIGFAIAPSYLFPGNPSDPYWGLLDGLAIIVNGREQRQGSFNQFLPLPPTNKIAVYATNSALPYDPTVLCSQCVPLPQKFGLQMFFSDSEATVTWSDVPLSEYQGISSVPEPSALVLTMFGLGALLTRQRANARRPLR